MTAERPVEAYNEMKANAKAAERATNLQELPQQERDWLRAV